MYVAGSPITHRRVQMIPKEFEEFFWRDYNTVRFHFRLQKKVAAHYRKDPYRAFSFSYRCSAAVYNFKKAIEQNHINLARTSRFREREDVDDKIECIALIEVQAKDFLEKLAFTLRLSQAEVLRMAMEWFMETIALCNRREVAIPARWKWHHRSGTPHIDTLSFNFYRFGSDLIWKYHPPKRKSFLKTREEIWDELAPT
jgi:hypothetical protein